MRSNRVLKLHTLIAALAIFTTTAQAGVPIQISYQGVLTETGGVPVTGSHTLTFHIFESSAGGAPLWTEIQAGVSVSEGLFNVTLGSVTALNSDVLAPAGSGGTVTTLERYLEVQVDADLPLVPRTRLVAAPYAVASGRVAGDAETRPGEIILSNESGTRKHHSWASDASAGEGHEIDGTQVMTEQSDADSGFISLSSERFSRPGINTARMVSGGTGATTELLGDDDGDGTAERALMAGTTSIAGPPRAQLRGWDSGIDQSSEFELSADDTGSSFDLNTRPNPQAAKDNHLQGAADILQARLVANHTDVGVDDSVTIQASRKSASIVFKDRTGTEVMRSGMGSDSSGASTFLDADSDGDGSPESMISGSSRTTGANMAIKTKGTGAQRFGLSLGAGEDSSLIENNFDENSDGHPERQFQTLSNASRARAVCLADLDGDGRPERLWSSSADASQARTVLGADLDADGVADNNLTQSCSGTEVHSEHRFRSGTKYWKFSCDAHNGESKTLCESDSDGDGVSDNSVTQSSADSTASVTVESRFAAGPRQSTSLDGSFSHSKMRCATDIDGDGSPEFSVENYSDATSARGVVTGQAGGTTTVAAVASSVDGTGAVSELTTDLDLNGVVNNSITQTGNAAGATLVVHAHGTGGSFRSTAAANDTSVIDVLDADSDDDGVDDVHVQNYCDGTVARMIVQKHLLEPHEARLQADDNGPSLSLNQTGALRILASPDSGLQVYDAVGAKKWYADADGDGYMAGDLKIGTTTGLHRIDVVGGAYCDGTNWVNGSDVHSKENFKPVDGAEILEKLERLDISRWNYKMQPNSEHIGPTAQDFHALFGLGGDDKSISTIDPAGIALAAIQALHQQNQDLQLQNQELTARLAELEALVNRLDKEQR